MDYNGIPVKEMVGGAKAVYWGKPTTLLCWNDDGPAVVCDDVILFNPTAAENRVVTATGKTYQKCALVPAPAEETRVATCRELLEWLKLNNCVEICIIGKSFKDSFAEIRGVAASDYKPTDDILDEPCNDNGRFNVSGLIFTGRNYSLEPMVPYVNYLIDGIKGIYEPTAECVAMNRAVFNRTYSIIITEHLAVSRKAVRYGFGSFKTKKDAERVKFRIFRILGGTPEGEKDIYIVPTAALAGLSRTDCGDMGGTCGIPQYLYDAYNTAFYDDVLAYTDISGFSTKVQILREHTKRSLSECCKALLQADGVLKQAEDLLTDHELTTAPKVSIKSDRA